MSSTCLSPLALQELLRRASLQNFDLAVQQALVAELTGGPTPLGEPPLDGRLEPVLDTLQFTLLKTFLRLDDSRALTLDAAFARGDALELPEFGWNGSWFAFWRFLHGCVGERFEDQLEEWQRQTLQHPAAPAVTVLWGALLVPRMARIFTAFRACRAGLSRADAGLLQGGLELASSNLGPEGELLRRLEGGLSHHLRSLGASAPAKSAS